VADIVKSAYQAMGTPMLRATLIIVAAVLATPALALRYAPSDPKVPIFGSASLGTYHPSAETPTKFSMVSAPLIAQPPQQAGPSNMNASFTGSVTGNTLAITSPLSPAMSADTRISGTDIAGCSTHSALQIGANPNTPPTSPSGRSVAQETFTSGACLGLTSGTYQGGAVDNPGATISAVADNIRDTAYTVGWAALTPVKYSTALKVAAASVVAVPAPGPSTALFNSPYYTCSNNRYLATAANGGSDSNDGTTPTVSGGHGPWATIDHADSSIPNPAPGYCINIGDGPYAGGTGGFGLTAGGSSAAATGYVVYRCVHMLQCHLDGASLSAGQSLIGFNGPSYIQFDGIDMFGITSNANPDIHGIYAANASTSHHIWILNSTIHGFTLSGPTLNGEDYSYVMHNNIYDNAQNSCLGGSGNSVWHITASAVSLTPDDHTNPDGALLGIPTFGTGTGATFRLVTAYNVFHNNAQTLTNCPNTDGNGFIFDDNTAGGYRGAHLVAYNVSYNNGGGCIHIFFSQNAWIYNNSAYNCYLDPNIAGSFRGMMDDERGSTASFPGHYGNNISVGINGTGTLADNSSWLFSSNSLPSGNVVHNISFKIGGGIEIDFENGVSSSVWNTSTNKTSTNPLWADVGRTSPGGMTTAPNGANFALCTAAGVPNAACPGSSPAVGYGVTQPFLPSIAVDAGACYHTLTSCPSVTVAPR
jgi:hypothetical protein